MKKKLFKPHFFSSVSQSLWNPEFYQKIPQISFGRSFGFLSILSLFVGLLVLLISWYTLTSWEPKSDEFMKIYNEHMPDITLSLTNGKLSSNSSPHFLGFEINADRTLNISPEAHQETFGALALDTSKTIENFEFSQEFPYAAALVSDGIVTRDFWGSQSQLFSSLMDPIPDLSYNKGDLAFWIKGFFPIAVDWVRTLLLIGLPLFAAVYTFASSWLFALLFLGFGMIILAVRKQELSTSHLIKLAFYCQVPALLITATTLFFGIFMPYLPLGVFMAYYTIAVMSYEG